MRKFEIKRIFDLTAQKAYRELIDWSRVRRAVDVLHAFGAMSAGPPVLPAFAVFAREHLFGASEGDLLNIKPGKTFLIDYEEILLTDSPTPPEGFPSESSLVATTDQAKPMLSGLLPEKSAPGEIGHPVGEILDHPRDIPVTSNGHNTMFDTPVDRMANIPVQARRIFETFSLSPDVLSVHLGQFGRRGARGRQNFTPRLLRSGSGYIDGRLFGPGDIDRRQDFRIQVTRGREDATYKVLLRLIED